MRVYITNSDPLAAVAISSSLFMIVMTSVIAGSVLPFGFAKAGVDPANAGTSIQVTSILPKLGVQLRKVACIHTCLALTSGWPRLQVLMDILGVAISCKVSTFVLDQLASGLGLLPT